MGLASPPFSASFSTDSTGSENSPGVLQVSDEEFAPIATHIRSFAIGIAMGQQCQWAPNPVSRKRHGPPDEDMEPDPFGWGSESGHPGVVNQGDGRNMKNRRRTTDDEETGVGMATQWDESQELPVQRTPARLEEKSKLGQHGLNVETLVAPLQGVSLPPAPGPTITGAALGAYEYMSQAWTEGSEDEGESGETMGIGDAHDEAETDKERWRRLMRYEKGRWICVGCGGKPFSDRCTLQRHCKSSVHSKARDGRICPFCPKKYLRSSNVRRHIRAKHPEEWERMALLRG